LKKKLVIKCKWKKMQANFNFIQSCLPRTTYISKKLRWQQQHQQHQHHPNQLCHEDERGRTTTAAAAAADVPLQTL